MTALALALLLAVQDDFASEKGDGPVMWKLKVKRGPYALAASPDGSLLAVGAKPGVLLVETETGKLRSSVKISGGTVRGLAFSPDGKRLAVAALGSLQLVDVATGKPVWEAKGHPDPMQPGSSATYGAAFAPDGKSLLTIAYDDPKLRSWSIEDGKELKAVETGMGSPRRLESAGGLVAVSGKDGSVLVLGSDLAVKWKGNTGGMNPGLALSQDGKLLAVGAHGRAKVYVAATGATHEHDFHSLSDGDIAGIVWLSAGVKALTATTRGGVQMPVLGADEEPPVLDRDFAANSDADRAAVAVLGGKAAAVAGKDEVRIYRVD